MSQTQRTLTQILTALADNTSRAITPQDIRDAVETLAPRHGTVYVTAAAPNAIATPGVFYPQASTTEGIRLRGFTASSPGRLTYAGVARVHAHIACTLSMSAGANNQTLAARLAKNGETLPDSEVRNRVAIGADVQSTALHADFHMDTGDFIELFVTNTTSTAMVQVDLMYLFALTMPM